MGKTDWTPEMINFLEREFATSLTKEIADELGLSVYAVGRKAKALGLKKEKNTVPDGFKKCSACKEVLEKECFGAKTDAPDGLQNYCRACTSIRKRVSYKKKIENRNKQEETENELRTCIKCNEEKLGIHFTYDVAKNYRSNTCKKCKTAHMKELKMKKIIQGEDWKWQIKQK